MRGRAYGLIIGAVLVLAGCSAPAEKTEAATSASDAGVETAAQTGQAAPTGFNVEQIPVSPVALPPMPMFSAPEGLESNFSEADKQLGFDAQNFIAGDRIVTVEGQVWHDSFRLEGPSGRRYSELEFRRNYENAIRGLGGVKINTAQFTPPVVEAFGGRAKVEQYFKGACVAEDCHIDTYLIRNAGKEFWINVTAGGVVPPHGYITILERQAMVQSVGYLTADQMKSAIDSTGRVALDINFDFDKATLTSAGQTVVDEIAKLLQGDPALKLAIEGHTDNAGTAARNRTLSLERANTVRTALIGKGIASARLTAAGFGPDRPVAGNGDDAGRARNRRVELVKVS